MTKPICLNRRTLGAIFRQDKLIFCLFWFRFKLSTQLRPLQRLVSRLPLRLLIVLLTCGYLVDVSTVYTIPQHSQRAFSTFEAQLSGWIIKARNAGKAGLEATEVLNFKRKTNNRKIVRIKGWHGYSASDKSCSMTLKSIEEGLSKTQVYMVHNKCPAGRCSSIVNRPLSRY